MFCQLTHLWPHPSTRITGSFLHFQLINFLASCSSNSHFFLPHYQPYPKPLSTIFLHITSLLSASFEWISLPLVCSGQFEPPRGAVALAFGPDLPAQLSLGGWHLFFHLTLCFVHHLFHSLARCTQPAKRPAVLALMRAFTAFLKSWIFSADVGKVEVEVATVHRSPVRKGKSAVFATGFLKKREGENRSIGQ